ncbi:cellulose binding domain-containing protein [Thermobifida halotolerans]|uniref:Cellulose binding domain-containing protein n=1 Tax=Thermobifida halotolerans TaxID=483545 RepID=A0AA97LVP4_9ACTN|nr:cellulose binding domain-containing protein [Thermobifida halotolerans]UOE18771.1 cellulose binding domain-containing protein [Thermobifida halotolerans]
MSRTFARTAAGVCGALALTAASVAATAAPAAASPADCEATYAVTAEWSGGFAAEVTVSNPDGGPVSGWTATWTLLPEQQIVNGWNGVFQQNGRRVRVQEPRDWSPDRPLPLPSSATFGFTATGPAYHIPRDLTCSLGW